MSTSRGIAITTIGNVIPPVAALVTQPILAQGLGVIGRGEVAAATAPLLLAMAILTLGLPESLTYHLARQFQAISRLTRMSIGALSIAGIAGSSAVALFAGPLSAGDDLLAQLITIAGLAITPALIFAALRGLAAGSQRWTLIAVERIANGLLRLVAVLILFMTGNLTPLTATITIAITTFVAGIVYVSVLGTHRKINAPLSAPEERPRLFRYGVQVWLGAATGMLLARLDQLLMTPLSSVEALGYYAVAVSISEVVLVFNSAVRDVMFAVESRSPDAARVSSASRISTLLTVAAAAAIATLCPWAIPFFFGSDFSAAVPVTLLLLVAIVLGNPGSVAGAALSGRGRPGLRSASIAIAAALNVIAVVLLVPSLGAVGAALATLLGNVVAGTLNIVWLRTVFGARMRDFYSFRVSDVRDTYALVVRLLRRSH